MSYDFKHIINITAGRITTDPEVCKHVIMFQWKLVEQLLSTGEYSKVRVKGFGNFEIKKSFLESYKKKIHKRLVSAMLDDEHNPTVKTANILRDTKLAYELFESIYLKFSKNEQTTETDSIGMDE